MDVIKEKSWNKQLKNEFNKPYFKELITFLDQEYDQNEVYPKRESIFKALEYCSFSDVKLVIIGQDPYHGAGQANGLSFSVNEGVKFPPSLRNIFKELATDVDKEMPISGDLSEWARQGVLLLNATLTVRASKAGSHQKKGWEQFTDAIIKTVAEQKLGVVFMLWGAYAQKKGAVIDGNQHLVLEAVHPSPLSAHRGFFGCKHFSKANAYFQSKGEREISW